MKQGYQFGRQVELIYQIELLEFKWTLPNPGELKPPATHTNENTIDRSERKQAIYNVAEKTHAIYCSKVNSFSIFNQKKESHLQMSLLRLYYFSSS